LIVDGADRAILWGCRSPKVELLHTLLDSLGARAAAPKKAAGAKTAVHQNGRANGAAAHTASNGHAELTNGHSNGHAEKEKVLLSLQVHLLSLLEFPANMGD
jgi:hypothetical protein